MVILPEMIPALPENLKAAVNAVMLVWGKAGLIPAPMRFTVDEQKGEIHAHMSPKDTPNGKPWTFNMSTNINDFKAGGVFKNHALCTKDVVRCRGTDYYLGTGF